MRWAHRLNRDSLNRGTVKPAAGTGFPASTIQQLTIESKPAGSLPKVCLQKRRQCAIQHRLHSGESRTRAIECVRLKQDISPAIRPAMYDAIPGIAQEALPVRG